MQFSRIITCIFSKIPRKAHWECHESISNLAETVMPPCDYQPLPYKDISYEEAKNIRQNKMNPALTLYYKKPVMIVQGHKQWLWDQSGKRYLDMFGGIVTVSVGHCHPKIKKAAIDQMNKLWHVTNIYMYPTIHEYSQKLIDRLPKDQKWVCFFCNSGGEANDLAMVMARLYTGAFDFISLRNGYHGCSPYTMSLCGVGSWKLAFANGFGVQQVMNADPYQGIWGGSHCRDSPIQTTRKCNCNADQCEASDHYADQIEEVLKYSLPQRRIAGFFFESIQGVGGVVQFPKGYLQKVQELIHNRGGLFIADEVQSGFGRTGKHYWGFQSHGVTPDIITMAKGMGNGFPISAVIAKPEIANTLKEGQIFNTFGGNPVACAVGSAVLDVIDDEKCMENSDNVGTYLLHKLAILRNEFEIVGDVRGKGLMIGVELVTDKKSQNTLPTDEVNEIFEDMKDMGVLIGKGGNFGNVFRIKPPMIINKLDADFCVSVMRKALMNHSERKRNN